ncbi:hypothetical protein EUX98_g8506 [Antrodiella citrinella]|uniref:Uncharacterized protein n=1 Tax=Antrodiella citrinella TaxID=2447956 RepID=A0A4S4M6E8_9APHY|nr:hypothetical protein EUX98_g8506 [Antrodiella citrinella]
MTTTHVYSAAEWKRQPTTAEVIFGLELPYRAPDNFIGSLLWRWRLWFEATFALSMLQPWEKVLIMFIVNSVLVLLVTGILLYFPSHLVTMSKRVMYYLLGTEAADIGFSESLSRLASNVGWRSHVAAEL